LGVNKLDIEFEDDDEIKAREEAERRKKEVVNDVDIEFGDAPEGASPESSPASEPAKKSEVKAAPTQKSAPAASQPKANPQPKQEQQQPQQQARPQQQQQPQQVQTSQSPEQNSGVLNLHQGEIQSQQISVGPDYKLGDELKKAMGSNQILAIEMEARIQVEATKMITDVIAKNAADAKLLEHKINKLVSAVAAKAPAMKKELLQIKRLVTEHARIGEEEEPRAESSPTKNVVKKKSA
tara:strand:+ start:100907 stop:101620 length:714 start_codon:yes stop_codon:yes gene_type:complete